ncbi:ABC transporter substrate-binding protein [Aureimonas leprariae]|uniref:Thiamine pyrimidine synthase n=1 Tax=Plantimonas leprariae TaxID=2615207 RepID=A0A7V7TYI4_9HYPH|nr:ABC transporter substrate-binding protein [Aureimonas leprariae]KAB0682801.1 ABC transporter substrate-binding protein [Aureimonas leprariae]
MPNPSRRRFLALAAAATAALAPRAKAQSGKRVTVALDWTPNTNHIGLFVAREKGFYGEAGLGVEILPYTDTAAGTLVANGVADFGILSTIGLCTQKAAGADLRGVFAVTRKETGRVVFDAGRNDIQRPRDLDGRTYGGFGSAWENALIDSIVRHDGGKGEFRTVTLGTSAYEALASGAVDFTLEVATWEGVEAELAGRRQRAFTYADYGVPDEHTTLIGSSDGYLAANGDATKAFLAATRRGQLFAAEHAAEAADILIAANGATPLDAELVRASLKTLNDGGYLKGPDGAVGTFEPAKIEAMGRYLFEAGILLDADGKPLTAAPDFAAYYTNSFLAP